VRRHQSKTGASFSESDKRPLRFLHEPALQAKTMLPRVSSHVRDYGTNNATCYWH